MTEAEKQALSTPQAFWNVINAEFEFQIDVCATFDTKKCEMYLGPDHYMEAFRDAFQSRQIWIDESFLRAWCNPPFRNVEAWHIKAHSEAQKHPGAVVAVLGLPGGSQEWFRFAYANASEIRLLTPRLQFDVPEGCERLSNSRDSVLYIYRRKVVQAPAHIVTWDWKAAADAMQPGLPMGDAA